MEIRLSRSEYLRMLAHAQKEAPLEACGLLGGTQEGDIRTVERVYLLTNVDQDTEHFTMDPKEQMQAVNEMRQEGLRPLGNWHSHPASPSRPSAEDIRLAYDSRATYMILSLEGEEPVLNAFSIQKGEVRREILIIQNN